MRMYERKTLSQKVHWTLIKRSFQLTVNKIFRKYGPAFRAAHPFLTVQEKKVINAISKCRTLELGGHLEVREECGHAILRFHSCRNRHCPQCQFFKKEQWIEARSREVFPFQYFHAVFTLPDELNPIVYRNKKIIYTMLFQKVKETLLGTAEQQKYFGAGTGFFSILHTWGQKLNLHPHLHCVIPGGGYDAKADIWKRCSTDYLLPVEVLKKRFKYLFLTELKRKFMNRELFLNGTKYENKRLFQQLLDKLFSKEWVVYLKEPFSNHESVIRYPGKYTHRITIGNYRIINLENNTVLFWYKDYKDHNKKKVLVLPADQFVRRSLQVLRVSVIMDFLPTKRRNKTLNPVTVSLGYGNI